MHKGSRRITTGQARKVLDAVPVDVGFTPSGIATAVWPGSRAIEREADKRRANGEMEKIKIIRPLVRGYNELIKLAVIPRKSVSFKEYGTIYRKVRASDSS